MADVKVGDVVQIKAGAKDVTNGVKATAGRMYGKGGPYWATVTKIVKNWNTGSKYGLPSKVTKVVCANKGVVVWQVQPDDLIFKKKKEEKKKKKKEEPKKEPKKDKPKKKKAKAKATTSSKEKSTKGIDDTTDPYIPYKEKWYDGKKSKEKKNDFDNTPYVHPWKPWLSDSFYDIHANDAVAKYYDIATNGTDDKLHNVWHDSFKTNQVAMLVRLGYSESTAGKLVDNWRKYGGYGKTSQITKMPYRIYGAHYKYSLNIAKRRNMMFNGRYNHQYIKNHANFPFQTKNANPKQLKVGEYDYSIRIDDSRFKKEDIYEKDKDGKYITLEKRLCQVRAHLGIPVHGSNDIARAMKLFMYNRFKSPDINLAHNKSFTYVFFTRPDCNLLEPDNANGQPTACQQALNHTDTALMWRRWPELFKLLSDKSKCGDNNNFNFLLSNQITSFQLADEELDTLTAGKSWNEYEIYYGDQYKGRGPGKISCTFTETSEYSIINLMKLWITYIDNVSRGAWSPYYPHDKKTLKVKQKVDDSLCHAYDRALDYGASIYVFKCGPDGEDVLYWTKYYGVFPIVTGASALSWQIGDPVGQAPNINIEFAYSYKKDLSPISLLEFNKLSTINKETKPFDSYNFNQIGSSRPYVGAPFIELNLASPTLTKNGVKSGQKDTSIRLKFHKATGSSKNGYKYTEKKLFQTPGGMK